MDAAAENILDSTYKDVKEYSFQEKKSPVLTEQIVNQFLDTINEFRNRLTQSSNAINKIIDKLEKISWISDDLKDDDLQQLHEIIALCRDLWSSLIRRYARINKVCKENGILKTEIKEFKTTLDDFKEVYEDIEVAFFTFPNDREFIEITERLNKIQ